MSWLYRLQCAIWDAKDRGQELNWFCLADGAYDDLKQELKLLPSVEDPTLDPSRFEVYGRPVFRASERPDLVPPKEWL